MQTRLNDEFSVNDVILHKGYCLWYTGHELTTHLRGKTISLVALCYRKCGYILTLSLMYIIGNSLRYLPYNSYDVYIWENLVLDQLLIL